jgi:hypothetical protein
MLRNVDTDSYNINVRVLCNGRGIVVRRDFVERVLFCRGFGGSFGAVLEGGDLIARLLLEVR